MSAVTEFRSPELCNRRSDQLADFLQTLDQAKVGTWQFNLNTRQFEASALARQHLALLDRSKLRRAWRSITAQGTGLGTFDVELVITNIGRADLLLLRGSYDAVGGIVRGVSIDGSIRLRAESLAAEQAALLASVVRGASQEACLLELTEAVARLQPGVRACVILADKATASVERVISAQLGENFCEALKGAPLGMPAVGTCAEAILHGNTVECADIEQSDRWSTDWKYLCLSHGVFSCASIPVPVKGHGVRASVFLCLPYARPMDDWERQIGDFGAFIASLLLERQARDVELAASLQETERQRLKYETFLDSSPDLAFAFDPEHRVTYVNRQLLQLWGKTRDEVIGKRCLELGYAKWHAELREREVDQVVNTGEVVRAEILSEEMQGPRMYDYILAPIFDSQARVVAVAGVARDVTERKRLEEEQRRHQEHLHVLVGELQHRTRNILSVVASIARSTLASSATIGDGANRLDQRLKALSRAYSLLSRLDQTERVCFDTLLKGELAAHCDIELMEERLVLQGPEDIGLQGSVVQALALALHELATNAVKYGAFSTDSARLHVSWNKVWLDQIETLHICWKESQVENLPKSWNVVQGGGAGRALIERALPYQAQARVHYELQSDGVLCEIWLPLPTHERAPAVNAQGEALCAQSHG